MTLPYIKKCFIFDFTYNITANPKTAHLGQVLINHILAMEFQDTENKYFYQNKINIVLMLYRISQLEDVYKTCSLDLTEKGLNDLFVWNLVDSKKNIFQETKIKKQRTYLETLFKILLNLAIKTQKHLYLKVLELNFAKEINGCVAVTGLRKFE